MKVVIAEAPTFKERTSKSSGRPYKLWTFRDVEGTEYKDVYTGFTVSAGDELDLTQSPHGGWTVVKTEETPTKSFQSGPKTFKADPEKMKQEWTLETARNLSIQRQKSADLAVQLVVAGIRDDLQGAYWEVLELIAPGQAHE